MPTVYKSQPKAAKPTPGEPTLHVHNQGESYSSYKEPDTTVPPKAQPLFSDISVDGVEISETEILAEAQNHPAQSPGAAVGEAARALVVRELLWQEAERQNFSADLVKNDSGQTETDRDAAIRCLIEKEVAVPQATEKEALHYYEQNKEKFFSDPLYEASHILLAASPEDKQERRAAKALAQTICAKLAQSPELFAGLAEEHSDCPSAKQGGSLGQLSQGSTVPEFEKTLRVMKPGKISSEPVETRYGFHIISLNRKIDGEQLPFEAVKTRVVAWLEASAWTKGISQYIAILAGQAKIKGIDLESADGLLVQ